MLCKNSIKKTKIFFYKTLQNLKNSFFGSYDKIPITLFLNPLSCASINRKTHQLDLIYSQFSNQTVTDRGRNTADSHSMRQTVKISPEIDPTDDDHKSVMSSSHEVSARRKQALAKPKIEPSSATSSCRYANDGALILAQKMKELDMMEEGDVDHALDVEEALIFYSRLNCPEYVDIVDKFFMDMYADFLLPQPSVKLSSSSRRLGPLKL